MAPVGVTPRSHDGAMSATSTPAPERRASTIPVSAALRAHRRRVIGWAVAHGHPLHRTRWRRSSEPSGSRPVTRVGVVVDRCRLAHVGRGHRVVPVQRCRRPRRRCRSLPHTYVRFLSAHRMFAKGSETTAALRRAVGSTAAGHPHATPSRDARPRRADGAGGSHRLIDLRPCLSHPGARHPRLRHGGQSRSKNARISARPSTGDVGHMCRFPHT